MAKVEICTPEQLKKLTTGRLDTYLEEIKNYMALEMPAEDLPRYQELIRNILAEKKSRETQAKPGARETQAKPGAREAQAEADAREAQAEPGVREAQAEPGAHETQAKPDAAGAGGNGIPGAGSRDAAKAAGAGSAETAAAPVESQSQVREQKSAPAETGFTGWDDSDSTYIDTSYDLEEKKLNKRDAGFVTLLLSLILTSALVGFAGLYIYMVKSGKAQPFEQMGTMLEERNVQIWCALVLAGLLFTLIGIFSRSAFVPVLAMLAYAGAAVFVVYYMKMSYYYAALTALQALFCLIAAIRKGRAE